MSSLLEHLQELWRIELLRDVADVLLVSVIIYYLLLLIRGTRAVQMLLGLMVLAAVRFAARTTELEALEATLQYVFTFLPFAIIVLFQQEIRRALATFGRARLWGRGHLQDLESIFDDLVLAATTLSERRVGALIVIERLEGLRNYIETGIILDAEVSLDLLINLFTPDTPTHDGAVIIQGNRIASASCFLPLTQNPEPSKEFGTRHRAALGITEETDALVVVVSEETGTISVAFGGELTRHLEGKDLRFLLYRHLLADLSSGARTP